MIINAPSSPTFGPSDSSDTAADLIGSAAARRQLDLADDLSITEGDPNLDAGTDRNGTGERGAMGAEEIQDGADIGFDRVVGAADAGLGAGLDQAEEAQLGITDEELEQWQETEE
jgi:hypothetical protein